MIQSPVVRGTTIYGAIAEGDMLALVGHSGFRAT